MELYLVRHGDALSSKENPERPLSERGREEVKKVAQKAAESEVKVSNIYHSGKLRAEQTAKILGEHLKPSGVTKGSRGLKPMDEPEMIQEEIETYDGPTMLVGHLPQLSRLTSLLATGNPDQEKVEFASAAMVALSDAEDRWEIKWVLTPQAKE